MHTSLIRNWGFELCCSGSDDDGPGSWVSYNRSDSWEVTNERFFGLQNFE